MPNKQSAPKDAGNLNDQVSQLLDDPRFRAAVRRTLEGSRLPSSTSDRLQFGIPEHDQMLAHSLDHHRDAAIAASQYFNISIQQFNCFRQVAEGAFDKPPEDLQVLDFACGYGRLLRFVSTWLPRGNVHGAEIQSDALECIKRLFGIDGYLSYADPEAFDPDRRFDIIWVASLFSHLPDRLFRAWLAKLHSLLAPGGVLCFSVRDASLFHDPNEMNKKGFIFQPESEKIPIESSIYGTAWASESYVRTAIQDSPDSPAHYLRLPRALAMEQDLYLLYPADRPAPVHPDTFRRGPWGWVDRMQRGSDGRIHIDGWAGSLDQNRIDTVEVRIDGNPARVSPCIERPDVAEAFNNPALERSGFEFNATLPESNAAGFVEVSAVGQNVDRALLYAGPTDTRGTTNNE